MKWIVLVFQLFLITSMGFGQTQGDGNETDLKGRKQGKWVKFHEGTEKKRYVGTFKNDIPIGSAKFKNGILLPKLNCSPRKLNCKIAKSTYLKNPSNPRFPDMLIMRSIFFFTLSVVVHIVLPT